MPIMFGCVMYARWYYKLSPTTISMPVVLRDSIVIPKYQMIPESDSMELIKLIPVLQKREGFVDTVYSDKKGNLYYGYGHMILSWDCSFSDMNYFNKKKCDTNGLFYWDPITKHQGDSILWDDIKAAYWECQRIERKSLYKHTYNIFISGKYN